MTHGTSGAIYGVDGKTVSIEEIKMLLNGENFPAMADKPKVLLIQACRGGTSVCPSVCPPVCLSAYTALFRPTMKILKDLNVHKMMHLLHRLMTFICINIYTLYPKKYTRYTSPPYLICLKLSHHVEFLLKTHQ